MKASDETNALIPFWGQIMNIQYVT